MKDCLKKKGEGNEEMTKIEKKGRMKEKTKNK